MKVKEIVAILHSELDNELDTDALWQAEIRELAFNRVARKIINYIKTCLPQTGKPLASQTKKNV